MASTDGIRLTIDKSGRIVVPKPLRERLGLKAGMELEAVDQSNGVLVRKVEEQPALVKMNGLWVHNGVAQPSAKWDRVIADVRAQRLESVSKSDR
jgi:AbrB family looped-hinge helix DNA binding protein